MMKSEKVREFFETKTEFERLLEDAEQQANSKWEIDYVADIRDRYDVYGQDMFISVNQLDKLREIAE